MKLLTESIQIRQLQVLPKGMIPQVILTSSQYQQVLQTFSNYLNDVNLVINEVKKSMYTLINVSVSASEFIVQPNIASVSAHGKKTIEDLKRISSLLRGYAKSRAVLREEEETRRSRIAESTLSRNTESRVSRYSASSSSAAFSKVDNRQESSRVRKDGGDMMVTFQLPQGQKSQQEKKELSQEGFVSRLTKYRSMRNLNKTSQKNNAQKSEQGKGSQQNSPLSNNNQSISFFPKPNESPRKRARTSEKQISKSISSLLNQTQTKFKECLVKHESGMDEIIKRNGECLDILKDIQRNIKNKKEKKNKLVPQIKQEPKKALPRYQSMTVAPIKQVEKNNAGKEIVS